jgi:hypothetical protein
MTVQFKDFKISRFSARIIVIAGVAGQARNDGAIQSFKDCVLIVIAGLTRNLPFILGLRVKPAMTVQYIGGGSSPQ